MSARLGDGIALKQRRRGDQDARKAIAALPGLLVEECLLHGMQRAVFRQALDGRHGLAGDGVDVARAGEYRLAVDQHHAGAALLGAAAEAGAAQAKVLAQHRQQRLAAVACRRERICR